MSRLLAKKKRPASGTFTTSSISRPMPLRPAGEAHGHARSRSLAAGQTPSSHRAHNHGGPSIASTTHTASHTSLSEWEIADEEDVHHRSTSIGRASGSRVQRDNHDHNHHEHHLRHVGSLHHPATKGKESSSTHDLDGVEDEDDFELIDENKEWRSTIESFDRQDVRMSMLFADAEYGQEMLFNIFPELGGTATKRTPLVSMPLWDKDMRASRLLESAMKRQREILRRLNSDIDADAIYKEELDKNIKRGLNVSRASRHAAEKVMRVVDGLVAAKVEKIKAIERKRAEFEERLRMTEGEVFPQARAATDTSRRHRRGPSTEPCLNLGTHYA